MVAGAHAESVVLVGADRRSAMWIEELLRAAWPGDLPLVCVDGVSGAAEVLLEHPAAWVLLDFTAFYAERIGLVSQLRTLSAQATIVVLSDHDDELEARSAIHAGAQDYLIKSELRPALLRRVLRHAAERARAEAELTHQALHDPLTGLPNRALFLDRLGVALDRCRRSGAAVAVLFLDVDDFKQVNDSRGHSAGDRVLIGLADRLRTMLRPMDTVCRFGGDEFTLLFEDLDNEREIVLIAERINQAAALPIPLEEGHVGVTVSIGVAMVADPDVGAETVIREADAAMYRAKQSGAARFELFDQRSRERAMERLGHEHALRRALDRSELCVHYQPTVRLGDAARVIGLEALVRWRDPARGLVVPGDFLELAEETGLIIPIGHEVIRQALRQLPAWRRQLPELTVSVNLSARQLEDVSLLSVLAAGLHGTAVQPRALCLEFSEAAASAHPEAALRTMQGLKAMGVRLAIDDFGLGTSSLSVIRRLPLDILKIHPSLLSGVGSSGRNSGVVGAMVELGHALGLSVVGEGVETEAQVTELRALGCDWAQGFWYGHPVEEAEVPGLLRPRARTSS